jgi:hypothetical protein
MNLRQFTLMLLLVALISGLALAQTSGGQVCVRVFEDRNADGLRDANEPFLTRGISASLADIDTVIIQSLLLEDSPRAAQGIICFAGLTAGQYTVTMTSADFTFTTPETYVTSVTETDIPTPYDFGTQPILTTVAPSSADSSTLTESEQRTLISKLFLSGLGAIVALAVMTLIGAILYFLFFRLPPAPQATGQYPAVRATGQYAVVPSATGQFAPVKPGTGQYPAAPPNSAMRPVDPATGQQVHSQFTPPTFQFDDTPPPAQPLPADDDTGKMRALQTEEPPVNPDDDTGRFRPPSNA